MNMNQFLISIILSVTQNIICHTLYYLSHIILSVTQYIICPTLYNLSHIFNKSIHSGSILI